MPAGRAAFLEAHCAGCHNDVDRKGGLDLEALAFNPADPANLQRWVRIHDRITAGEMPPEGKRRPEPAAAAEFTRTLGAELAAADADRIAREGRAGRRRLNGHEYENALRDLLSAPWLQIRGQFPEDGEAHRFNKSGSALDVSHVHLARYLTGLCIFLGLLGTFWGLLGTVGSIANVIRNLTVSGEDIAVMFTALKEGLEAPLSSMSTRTAGDEASTSASARRAAKARWSGSSWTVTRSA